MYIFFMNLEFILLIQALQMELKFEYMEME